MQYRLKVIGAWHYRDRRRGLQVLGAGVYSVPHQVEERLARLCVDQGMGHLYEVRLPDAAKPLPALEPVSDGYVSKPTASAHPPKRKRGKRRKGPAPENKIVHVAENKTPLV